MAFSIQNSASVSQVFRGYNKNSSALAQNIERLSTGYKINHGGENAAGLAVSEKLRNEIVGLDTASSNVQDSENLVQTGEGALQEIQDMTNRLKELAVQAANGTFDDETDRPALQEEVEQILDEITRIAETTNFNNIYLLDGTYYYDCVEYDFPDGYDYEQDCEYIAFQIGNTGEDYQLVDIPVFDMFPEGLGLDEFNVSTQVLAILSLDLVDDAINCVSEARGEYGALQNRLAYAFGNLSTMTVYNQESESVIRDTDVADEMMKFTANNLLADTSQSMVAHSNQQTQQVLDLFTF